MNPAYIKSISWMKEFRFLRFPNLELEFSYLFRKIVQKKMQIIIFPNFWAIILFLSFKNAFETNWRSNCMIWFHSPAENKFYCFWNTLHNLQLVYFDSLNSYVCKIFLCPYRIRIKGFDDFHPFPIHTLQFIWPHFNEKNVYLSINSIQVK